MTIAAWIVTSFFAIIALGTGIFVLKEAEETRTKVITWLVVIVFLVAMYGGVYWYFHNTASGARSLIDEKSELQNGLNRTINIYTADGNIIKTYTGQIDLEADQSYVKFDWEGKRYIYYNCYIETIADIP